MQLNRRAREIRHGMKTAAPKGVADDHPVQLLIGELEIAAQPWFHAERREKLLRDGGDLRTRLARDGHGTRSPSELRDVREDRAK